MTDNLDTLRKVVENAGEAWSGGEHIDIVTPPTVLALLSRLEQAEHAVERAKAECTRQKQQKGILFRRATEAEQAVQRVRDMAEEMGEAIGFDRLTHGQEAEYPVSYFRDKLEEALDGDIRG